MILPSPSERPQKGGPVQRTGKAMQVILHVGAHRCATTSFQDYMRFNAPVLSRQGLAVWGPDRTRDGLFHGIQPSPTAMGAQAAKRAQGRLRLRLDQVQASGAQTLLISDENMIGSVRENLRLAGLYSGIGERLARFHEAFDGRISGLAINLRSLETYWTSALTYAVARGHPVPSAGQLDRIIENSRSWRDVLTDIACSMPDIAIRVLPFETFGGRPEQQLHMLTGCNAPRENARMRHGSSPRLEELRKLIPTSAARSLPEGEGRWRPLNEVQSSILRERYADDLMWLAAGADGLSQIQLMYDPEKQMAAENPPENDLTRGRPHDEDRRLAGSG